MTKKALAFFLVLLVLFLVVTIACQKNPVPQEEGHILEQAVTQSLDKSGYTVLASEGGIKIAFSEARNDIFIYGDYPHKWDNMYARELYSDSSDDSVHLASGIIIPGLSKHTEMEIFVSSDGYRIGTYCSPIVSANEYDEVIIRYFPSLTCYSDIRWFSYHGNPLSMIRNTFDKCRWDAIETGESHAEYSLRDFFSVLSDSNSINEHFDASMVGEPDHIIRVEDLVGEHFFLSSGGTIWEVDNVPIDKNGSFHVENATFIYMNNILFHLVWNKSALYPSDSAEEFEIKDWGKFVGMTPEEIIVALDPDLFRPA